MLVELFKKCVTYTNKKGETKKAYNYYVKVNNRLVAIKPTFADNKGDYALLSSVATELKESKGA